MHMSCTMWWESNGVPQNLSVARSVSKWRWWSKIFNLHKRRAASTEEKGAFLAWLVWHVLYYIPTENIIWIGEAWYCCSPTRLGYGQASNSNRSRSPFHTQSPASLPRNCSRSEDGMAATPATTGCGEDMAAKAAATAADDQGTKATAGTTSTNSKESTAAGSTSTLRDRQPEDENDG